MKFVIAYEFIRRRTRSALTSTPSGRRAGVRRHGLVWVALLLAAKAGASECSESKPERFGEFFAQFSSNVQFALSRTVLPLLTEQWSDDDWLDDLAEPLNVWITRDAYARRPSLQAQINAQHLAPQITFLAPASATVELRNRLHAPAQSLHFRLDSGCWKLWSVDEFEASD